MSASIILVIGGVRSGKSRVAAQLASELAQGSAVRFIATAKNDPADPVMAARIGQHRSSRPADWVTVEAPVDLAGAILGRKGEASQPVILVDCLTLWLGNVLEAAGDPEKRGFAGRARAEFESAAGSLLKALDAAPQPVVIVKNEVGSGVAPPTTLGNVFADLQGELNQAVAAAARAVYHVVAGIPTRIK